MHEPPDTSAVPAAEAERRLIARLRAGDEAAFMEIVDAWGPAMLRLARQFTPSAAVAEEVVQETWLAVLDGLDRFEGRSSLKTWVMRILVNRAKTRGARERRTVPFAALASEEASGELRGRRGRPLPRRRPRAVAPPLGRAAAALGGAARGRRPSRRRRSPSIHDAIERAAARAAHGHPAARHRGLGRAAGE